MKIDLGSFMINATTKSGGGTPSWGTELGQGEGYKFSFDHMGEMFAAMVYKAVKDKSLVNCPLGKGGNQQDYYEFVLASLFDKIYANGTLIQNAQFLLLVIKKLAGEHHVGRRTLKYNRRMTYDGVAYNEDCINKIPSALGISSDASWFVSEIQFVEQEKLNFIVHVFDNSSPVDFRDSNERKNRMLELLPNDEKARKEYTLQSSLGIEKEQNERQIIFYGAPGTGKSFSVKKRTGEIEENGEEVERDNVFRTTFHPDTDYASFVGCYKPFSSRCKKYGLNQSDTVAMVYPHGEENAGDAIEENVIEYKFVPQTFTDAYVYAYSHPDELTYLVIEEINRGNCAQIFGDLFQLLDRKEDGSSEYSIKADRDLADYLERELGKDTEGIIGGKLRLPANLHILATMNTSDQSLFPMDSAFKRRWDWEYIPISYTENRSSTFHIKIDGEEYKWVDFIQCINPKISKVTKSEDKQLGNFFIKSSVDTKQFKSKVMFYLWNEVLRDEMGNSEYFFYTINAGERNNFTFKDLYEPDAEETLKGFMAAQGIKPITEEDADKATEPEMGEGAETDETAD